jgi:tight adherence protein C
MNNDILPAYVLALASAGCAFAGVMSFANGGVGGRLPIPVGVPHPSASTTRGGRRVQGSLVDLLRRSKVVRSGAIALAILPALLLPMPLPLILLFVFVGVLVVRRFATGRARRRYLADVDAEVPQLLDLLAAGSSAGLAAPLALRRAADGVRGPLADEIRGLSRAVDLGARWRDELTTLTDRLAVPDLRRTAAVLTRTETLGSSLEDATAELAASVRQARRAAVMERARAAPVKMLFPLVFLVLPAFLLLTVVPVLLTTVQSIR